MPPAARTLILSASFLFLVSSLVGVVLLIPLQPWGRFLARRISNFRSLVAGHVDWVLLAAMQLGAAYGVTTLGAPGDWVVGLLVVGLLVVGAWLNAIPYFIRGLWGVDAMVFGGGALQRAAASLGLLSATALIASWSALIRTWVSS